MADDLDRYVEFMSKEIELANYERFNVKNVEEVQNYIKLIEEKRDIKEIKEYINKHLYIMLNYAPHLTLQLFLQAISQNQLEIVSLSSTLQDFLKREDLPAKAYSVINSYISMLKQKETTPPNISMASNEKIKKALDELNVSNIQSLFIMLQLRFKFDTNYAPVIDILNEFFMSPNKEDVLKLTVFTQLATANLKFDKPFELLIDFKKYTIILDGSLDLESDPFIKSIDYLSQQEKASIEFKNISHNVATMYRLLNYNVERFFNSEKEVKSFYLALLDIYNKNVMYFAPNIVMKTTLDVSLRDNDIYKEVQKFVSKVFKS